MAQPKSQLPLYLGIAAAGGVGYYLYTAGGSPKVAEKQFESTLTPGMTLHSMPNTYKCGANCGSVQATSRAPLPS